MLYLLVFLIMSVACSGAEFELHHFVVFFYLGYNLGGGGRV